VPPVFHSHSAMAHTASSCRGIASRYLATSVAKILESFLARSRYTIPRADPTVLLRSGSNGYYLLASRVLVTLNTQHLGSKPCELSEFARSPISDTCPPQMDGSDLLATSPLRQPRVSRPLTPSPWAFPLRTPEFARSPISDTCPPQMDGSDLLASRVLVTLNTQRLGLFPANSRVREISRSLPPGLLRWTALIFSPLRRFANLASRDF
jgi:hypothetical protein